MACDICGKTGTSLVPLRDIYKTDEIQVMCPECEKIVDKQLNRIQESHGQGQRSLLKRFMSILKNKFQSVSQQPPTTDLMKHKF